MEHRNIPSGQCECPQHQYTKKPEVVNSSSDHFVQHPQFSKDFPGYLAVKCGNQTALLYISKFRNGNQSIHLAHSNQSFTPEEFTQTHNPNPMTRPDPWYDYINWAGASIGRHRRRGQLPVHTISCKCDWCRFAMGYMRRSSSSKWAQATSTSTRAFLGEEKRRVDEEKRPQNEEKRNKVDKVSLTKHFRQFVTVDELLEAYRVLETMDVDVMDSGEDFQDDDEDEDEDFEAFSLGPQAEEAIACLDSLEMEAERLKSSVLDTLLQLGVKIGIDEKPSDSNLTIGNQ